MHITLETKKLQQVLDVVSRVSTKHLTLPVLQCVLLEAKDSTLYIRATNLEIGIEGSCPTTQEEPGVVAVSAQVLLQTIHLLTQSSVTLSTEGDVLRIESKSSKTDLKTVPADEFPTIPKQQGSSITMQGSVFALGVKTTAFTASQSTIKPELGSVYIYQKKEHTLTFVATDSFRLMEKTVPQRNVSLTDPILIPYKNALELARVAELATGDITLYVSENQCALRVDGIYITSRLVTGTFPDYEQIIPKEYKTTVTLLTKDFAQALKKTNIFLNKFMQLTLTISGGTFTLSSQSGESGATTESIPASVEGEELLLNFNQRYIHEAIPQVSDESIRLKCAGIGRPMVIENVHDHSLRYLVMPMNK
jgi:DNA polymerase III subunit beta